MRRFFSVCFNFLTFLHSLFHDTSLFLISGSHNSLLPSGYFILIF